MHNIYQKDTHSKPDYVGKVEKIEKIESTTMKGSLITAYIDGYGYTQPFYEAGEGVLLSEIDERRNYSGMPVSFIESTCHTERISTCERCKKHLGRKCRAGI